MCGSGCRKCVPRIPWTKVRSTLLVTAKLVTMLLPTGCMAMTPLGAWLSTCPVLVLIVCIECGLLVLWLRRTVIIDGLPSMTFRLCVQTRAPVALRLTDRLPENTLCRSPNTGVYWSVRKSG